VGGGNWGIQCKEHNVTFEVESFIIVLIAGLIKFPQVMAMTSQIFLNLLRHGYIKFSQIALLIFDECHHAVKDHPMSNVIKFCCFD
jgi:superfamily II DNA or RNA helicase